MMSQIGFQNLLLSRFNEARRKNPSYSLRAFASKLGIDAGPLSQILKGKRRVSEKLANRILDQLEVDLSSRARALIRKQVLHQPLTPRDQAYLLGEDQFRLISDWYHYAILSLLQVKNFKNHSSWIANRLAISENQVRDAIDRMKRLEMIEETKYRTLKRRHPRMMTTDHVPSESLKKSHEQTLDLAKKSLRKDSNDKRDFIHLTIPTHPDQIKKAKLYLRRVQDELRELLMDTPDKTEVYRLSIQLFPLTQLIDEESTS